MKTNTVALFDNERSARRDRLKREVAYLKALGATPERFLRTLTERTRCERAPVLSTTGIATAFDPAAVRELAKLARDSMRPWLDEARRTLIARTRTLSTQTTAELQECLDLLEAMRYFDAAGPQLDEVAETLQKHVHATSARRDDAGGTQRLEA